MHIFFAILFTLIFFFSPSAYSQDNLSKFAGREISSIKIISDRGITERDISKECGINAGDQLSIQRVRECIAIYYSKGFLKDVIIEAVKEEGGIGLQFNFVERKKLAAVSIKGNNWFSAKKIKSVIGLKRGDELTDEKTTWAKEILTDLYKGAGFFDASIEITTLPEGRGQEADIAVRIEEKKRARVADIMFSGDRVFRDEKLITIMRIQRGDYFDEKKMNLSITAIDKYYTDKGYLKILIGPPELLYDRSKGEVTVTFSIEAGPHVEVVFEGTEVMDPEILKKELLIWKERTYDNAVLDESADRLMQYYHRKGYYFAEVVYNADKLTSGNIRIMFRIKEGMTITVEKISFTGNSYFTDKKLNGYLDIREGKFLVEDMLKEYVKGLINLYRNNGFLNIKITPDIVPGEDNRTLNVTITIDEGIQTFLSNIHIKGNETFGREGVISLIKSREGQPYNESHVMDDLYSIQSFYIQRGYIYASVDLKSEFSPERNEVQVDYTITEYKPVYIGNINVSGNSFTKEDVIRRELLIKEGDLYNYENILRSQRQLLRLGIFKDVKLEPANPDVKEQNKDISVRVEEGYPGTVEIGAGYGDVDRFRGMFEGSYRNLFGTGRQISIRAEGSSIEQKYSLSYKEPWVLGYQMDGRINLVDLVENKRSFDRRTLGFSTGIDKSFSEFVKGSLMYQYEDVRLSGVSPEAVLTPEDIGKVAVATINPSIIIDRRNDPFNPSKGALYSITFREAAKFLGSRPQFAKITVQDSYFFSPVSKLVFAFSLRGGVAWNFGESQEVPIFERYFVGGRSTVRGYDQERLGIPGKTITIDGNPTGGNMMVVINGEIRFPLFRGLGMVVFMDGGNVWREVDEFDISEIKSTAGAGIRYNTPVGPLRLDIGCKLDREAGEDKCLPHFTLGHAF